MIPTMSLVRGKPNPSRVTHAATISPLSGQLQHPHNVSGFCLRDGRTKGWKGLPFFDIDNDMTAPLYPLPSQLSETPEDRE